MSFDNIKGNQKLINHFKDLIKNRCFPSCCLFYGQRGIGKFMTAFEIAKAHFCSQETQGDALFNNSIKNENNPCDKCQDCIAVEKRLHPDFRIVDTYFQAGLLNEPPDKQRTIKIDSLREISKFAYEKPYVSRHKFIIIDQAETMTIEAQNFLLKILEEPPESAKIILVSSDKNLLLPTIVSRAYPFRFLPLENQDLVDILGNFSIDYFQAQFLADISGGCVSKAVDFAQVLKEIKSKRHLGKLIAFSMLSPKSQLYQQKAKTAVVLDFLISVTAMGKINPPLPFSQKAVQVNRLLSYSTWLKHNVSPRVIMQLAVNDYLKFGNFDFGEKI